MAHGAEPATVSSFHELYRWVDHTIGFVANATGQGPVPLRGQIAERSKGFTMSTAFSGIGAPENALHAIMCHLGCECSRPLYNIEWDLECRRELCALPHPPMCLFDDINQFWNETNRHGQHFFREPVREADQIWHWNSPPWMVSIASPHLQAPDSRMPHRRHAMP